MSGYDRALPVRRANDRVYFMGSEIYSFRFGYKVLKRDSGPVSNAPRMHSQLVESVTSLYCPIALQCNLCDLLHLDAMLFLKFMMIKYLFGRLEEFRTRSG